MNRPPETIGHLDGLYYKIGRFDKPFYWDGDQWCLSDKTKSEIKRRLELEMKKK
jgi:hypothetical protein